MFRQDDKNRRWGEYRFYPYFLDESQYGSFYLGYAYNVAHILHKGAKEITFLKVAKKRQHINDSVLYDNIKMKKKHHLAHEKPFQLH